MQAGGAGHRTTSLLVSGQHLTLKIRIWEPSYSLIFLIRLKIIHFLDRTTISFSYYSSNSCIKLPLISEKKYSCVVTLCNSSGKEKEFVSCSEEEEVVGLETQGGNRTRERDRVKIAVWVPEGWPVIIKPLWSVCTFPQILLSHAQ